MVFKSDPSMDSYISLRNTLRCLLLLLPIIIFLPLQDIGEGEKASNEKEFG